MASDSSNNERSEEVPLDDLLGSLPSFEQQFDPDPSPTSLHPMPARDDDGPPPITVSGSPKAAAGSQPTGVSLEEAESKLDIASGFSAWRLKRRLQRNKSKRQQLGHPVDRHEDDPFAQLLQPLSKSELRKESIPPKRIFLHRKERWRRQEDRAQRGGILLGLGLFSFVLWQHGESYLNRLVDLKAPAWFSKLPSAADDMHLQILIVFAVFAPLAILAASSIGITAVLRGIIRRKPFLSLEGVPGLAMAWIAFGQLRHAQPTQALVIASVFLVLHPLLRAVFRRLFEREERV